MRLALFISSFLALSGGVGVCAAPNKGKQVVDEAIQALGGQAFLNLHTRVASGRIFTFFRSQLSGYDRATVYTEYRDKANSKDLQTRERQVLGKKQDYSYLFLENEGFEITYRGARLMADERWDRFKRSTMNDILYLLRFRHDEPGLEYDYVGNQVYITNHVEVVDITDSTGQTIRVAFDYNTKLPVKESFSWLDPETKQRNDEVTEFDKWRDAGSGVKWPFTIERSYNGYKVYQMFAEKVEVNAETPDKIFEAPQGTLLKKMN